MPAALDLAKQRFGQLTVIRADGRVFWGRDQAAWLCRCDCGAKLRVPQRRLTSRVSSHQQHACDACRARPCEVCGAPVAGSSTAKTCSAACAAERQRRYQLAYYHEVRATDPADTEARRSRGRARWHRLTPDQKLEESRRRKASESRDRINERARDAHARRMENPAYAERRREQQAAWQEAHREKARAHSRNYRRRQRALARTQELGAVAETLATRMEDSIDE